MAKFIMPIGQMYLISIYAVCDIGFFFLFSAERQQLPPLLFVTSQANLLPTHQGCQM